MPYGHQISWLNCVKAHSKAGHWRETPFLLCGQCEFLIKGVVAMGAGAFHPGQTEVFTLPLVFHMDPRGMAQILRNSAESADPRIPFFLVYCDFTIPHGMMQNLDPFCTDLWNLLGLFRAKYSLHRCRLFFVHVWTDYI